MTNITMLRQSILSHAQADPRMVGLLDYGSTSEGRGDEWSDLDLVVFIRDEEFEAFEKNWKGWAAQFGELMLAYIGGARHPWAVYDAEPIPNRVDFAFYKASQTDEILKWPLSPMSVKAMVLYDDTSGIISSNVARLVGKSLQPDDNAKAFEQVAGDFWYYVLRLYSKIQRGQWWSARFEYDFMVVGNLHALLRLESGATERWKGSTSATGIEIAISAERLAQLNGCIPDKSNTGLIQGIRNAIKLGRETCASLGTRVDWEWPVELSAKLVEHYRDL